MDNRIEIDSFNPYEGRFPNRKLIDKDTLKLIKILRQQGYQVVVRPINNQPTQYLFRKGLRDLLSDPFYAYLINQSSAAIVTIITNYIQKLIDKDNNHKPIINVFNNIIINDFSQQKIFDLNGKIYSIEEIKDIQQKGNTLKEEFSKSISIVSPYPTLPTPIFFEHTPLLAGWCKISVDHVGLKIDDSIIVDKSILEKINEGEIKGASITGIAEKSTCSICNANYIECNHIAGEIYGDKSCHNSIEQSTIIELSLVKTPVNSECIVSIKKSNENS